jgi:hypothetical protein
MAKIEEALARLEAALGAAEDAARQPQDRDPETAGDGEVAGLLEERERLLARIALLEEQAEEDARLRAEAAEAVKAALGDLRAVARAEGDRRHG